QGDQRHRPVGRAATTIMTPRAVLFGDCIVSDNWIHLIPVSPDFVPPAAKVDKAVRIVAEAWPTLRPRVVHTKKAEFEGSWPDVVIQVVVRDEIELVFGMENFEGAFCPFCGTRIDDDWWGNAFDHASKVKFRDLA